MRAIDTMGRPGVVLGLLVVAGVALRGELPGDRPVVPRPPDPPASPALSLSLLGVAMAFFGVALVASLRRGPRPAPGGPAQLPEWLTRRSGGSGGRRSWAVLLGAAMILMFVTLGVLLFAVSVPHQQALQPHGAQNTQVSEVTPAPTPAEQPSSDTGVVGLVAAADAVLVVLLALGSAVVYTRNRRAGPAPSPAGAGPVASGTTPDTTTDTAALAWATELALAQIADPHRGPREAIIASYATLERALADAPNAAPQDSDTPSEVLARAVGSHALRADVATELVALFTEARFSTHVMTEEDRDTAIDALAAVLGELRHRATGGAS